MIDLVLAVVLAAGPSIDQPDMPVISRSMTSKKMNDVHLRDSSYTGTYFDADQEPYRKCVAERESNGHAWSRSKSRTYHGAYQVSNDLWRGATYMMAAELKQEFGPVVGKRIAVELRSIKASEAATRWQTQAFYTILNWDSKWSGKSHWAGGRWTC